MSFEITTGFVQQYRETLALLSQQLPSRLRPAVTVEPGVRGTSCFMDQIGSTEAQDMSTRHGDTPVMNTPHRRRMITLGGRNWADLIDSIDKVQMLTDPSSIYARAGNAGMNRKIDRLIVAAFFADAKTGVDGTTTVTFPAANQVAVDSHSFDATSGNIALTVSKLQSAKLILDANEAGVDMPDERFIAVNAFQLQKLLSQTEVKSADYNTIKALVQGELDTFLGFKFIRTELLTTDSSGYQRIPVWCKSGIGLAIGEDIKTEVTPRADKNYSTQVYYEMFLGAARIEEAKVVEIKCLTT